MGIFSSKSTAELRLESEYETRAANRRLTKSGAALESKEAIFMQQARKWLEKGDALRAKDSIRMVLSLRVTATTLMSHTNQLETMSHSVEVGKATEDTAKAMASSAKVMHSMSKGVAKPARVKKALKMFKDSKTVLAESAKAMAADFTEAAPTVDQNVIIEEIINQLQAQIAADTADHMPAVPHDKVDIQLKNISAELMREQQDLECEDEDLERRILSLQSGKRPPPPASDDDSSSGGGQKILVMASSSSS